MAGLGGTGSLPGSSVGEVPMTDRRSFLRMLAVAGVAMAVVVAPAIAEEFFGVITKVDIEGKKLTVVEKDTDKEVTITTNDATETQTKDGYVKVDLEKLSKNVDRAKEKGKKGVMAKITHEKGVASKISVVRKKAAN
jgi:hypothetical protein